MSDIPVRPQTYEFDNTDLSMAPNLFDTLNDMRTRCPVAWSPASEGFWALTKYDDVMAAARDHEHFTVTDSILIPRTGSSVKVIPAELDPPRHTKFRKLVLPYFTEPALQKWVPDIRAFIRDAFAPLLPHGRGDLVRDVAHQVPVLVISQILGTLGEDPSRVHSLTTAFLDATKSPEAARESAGQLHAYLQEAIDARRGRPPVDMLGELVNASIDGEPISNVDMLGMAMLLVVAGHETTVNGIATITHRIVSEPGLLARLLADRSLLTPVIDEALRLHPPVWNMGRTVVEDIEVRGARLCSGEPVMLTYGAANRDPDFFPEPENFVAPRPNNRHLSFGSGRHRCLGEPLARMELTFTIEYILDNIPDIAPDGEPVWSMTRNSHGMASFPIRFAPHRS